MLGRWSLKLGELIFGVIYNIFDLVDLILRRNIDYSDVTWEHMIMAVMYKLYWGDVRTDQTGRGSALDDGV